MVKFGQRFVPGEKSMAHRHGPNAAACVGGKEIGREQQNKWRRE